MDTVTRILAFAEAHPEILSKILDIFGSAIAQNPGLVGTLVNRFVPKA